MALIEACGAEVRVRCLGPAAARHLRGRAAPADDPVACAAEVEAVVRSEPEAEAEAEVVHGIAMAVGGAWGMVPGARPCNCCCCSCSCATCFCCCSCCCLRAPCGRF